MNMEMKTRELQHVTILDLAGDLTYANRAGFKAAVENIRQTGCRHLVLNMEQVRFLDSSGVGMLALFCQTFRLSKAKLSVLRPQPYVREILTLANIHKMMAVYGSEEEAIASSNIPMPC